MALPDTPGEEANLPSLKLWNNSKPLARESLFRGESAEGIFRAYSGHLTLMQMEHLRRFLESDDVLDVKFAMEQMSKMGAYFHPRKSEVKVTHDLGMVNEDAAAALMEFVKSRRQVLTEVEFVDAETDDGES